MTIPAPPTPDRPARPEKGTPPPSPPTPAREAVNAAAGDPATHTRAPRRSDGHSIPHPLGRPWLIAHRGAVRVAPENSAAAVAAAADLGADVAEIDVQLTRDGVPVLLHDQTVNRTTDGSGRLGQMTWREVARLRDRAGARLPTLDEVLAIAADHGLRLAVELKQSGPAGHPTPADAAAALAERVVRGLAEQRLLARCWAWSFRAADLERLAGLAPGLTRGALSFGWPGARLQRWADQWIPLAAHLAAVWPQRIGRAGVPVIAWTNDHPALARRFLAAGIAGLITDDVARLRPVVTAGTGGAGGGP